ncbi:MAG: hypothetical protein ACXVAY_07705 [Mucilaginibacter sp.]
MNTNTPVLKLRKLQGYLDWQLLLFLVLFLDVKLVVKLAAIILIYALNFNLKFGFNIKNSRLPLFYLLVPVIGLFNYFVGKNYSNANYAIVLLTGIGFWGLCILAVHQVKLAIERNPPKVIHQTLLAFFLVNAVISLLNLVVIVWHTHAFNPYTYQGEYQKYFVSTGDFVKGLTFDTSTTNAVLNAFGVVYFLTKKNAGMVLVCMAVLLLTGSNFTNVVLLVIMLGLFIFKTDRVQKSLLVVCCMFLVVFMAKISPQNNDYLVNTLKIIIYQKDYKSPWPTNPIPLTQRPDSTLTPYEKKQKLAMLYLDSVNSIHAPKAKAIAVVVPVLKTDAGKIVLPKPNLDAPIYQNLATTPPEQVQLADFVRIHKSVLPISGHPKVFTAMPGKVTAMVQTINFLKQHPAKIITGAGIGNFSSKLAFRTTGLRFTGGYPAKYVYISRDFLVNHLDIYLNFFSRGASLHSLTNSPFSVYDQLLSEYGVLGLTLLFVFYIGFFAKYYKQLSYGIPLLALVLAVFFIDYWFEQLSVLVMFELMMFLDLKEHQTPVKALVENMQQPHPRPVLKAEERKSNKTIEEYLTQPVES